MNRLVSRLRPLPLFSIFSILICCFAPLPVRAAAVSPQAVLERLSTGAPQEVIVLYDDSDVEVEAAVRRQRAHLDYDDDSILSFRAARYYEIKEQVKAAMLHGDVEYVQEYSHLPMSFVRFKTRPALERFLARPGVMALYENRPIYPYLAQSLPLINQPTAIQAGFTGSTVTVAIIDTGIDYTLAAFGSCSAPGVPVGCNVVASVDVTGSNITLNTDPNNHGTNVAGIVAGVAPGARIAAVNAFSAGSSNTNWIISGINWAIVNRSSYNIVALNMSLGDGVNYSAPCNNRLTNPFLTPLNNARSTGILPIAASGNEGFTNGIANPACTPGVVSVGAVYDSNVGGLMWNTGASTTCTDTTAADKVICLSNSASFLTMMAPGALISAAESTMGGTSQAAPHVAGAVAVLREAFPADSLDQTTLRLTANGVSITDPRNAIVKPRLNLAASLGITPPQPIDGVCGSANGQTFNTAPTTDLCSTGTASALTGSGSWYWTCVGQNGGSTANCGALITSYSLVGIVTNSIGGTITPDRQIVNYGGSATFTIQPLTGYILAALSDNGSSVTATEGPIGTFTYTITAVTASHTVEATFAATQDPTPVPALSLPVILFLVVVLSGILYWKGRKEK
jgi:subtilisin family serine protease